MLEWYHWTQSTAHAAKEVLVEVLVHVLGMIEQHSTHASLAAVLIDLSATFFCVDNTNGSFL